MTKAAFMGDMHGNWSALHIQVSRIINEHPDVNLIYQVGDFGLFPGTVKTSKRLHRVDRKLAEAGVEMFVTPGNHEDWGWMSGWLHDGPTALPGGFTNITVLPRVWRWTIGDTKFLSVSGANSIDFEYRVPGKTWWPEEQITDDIVAEAVSGGSTDVLICHDSPLYPATPSVDYIINHNPGGWGWQERAYAEQSSHQLMKIASEVIPSFVVHGHMHVRDTLNDERLGIRVESLDIEGSEDAWIVEEFS